MSRLQYAFIVGVLLVWVAWDAGWIIFAAVAAGLIGVGIVKALEGDIDFGEMTKRFQSSSDKNRR
jgi:hypothetical protein